MLAIDVSQEVPGEPAIPELRLTDPRGREHAVPLGPRPRATIGRASDCDVILNDQRVSRRHATLELVDGHYLLRDEGSSNGTFLNGLRLTPGSAFSLREGDVIDIGECRICYGRAPATTPSDEKTAHFTMVEVTAQGYARLDPLARREIQVEVQRAFDGVPRVMGIERALRVVIRRVDVATATFFAADITGRLRSIATIPAGTSVAALADLASGAWRHGDARVRHGTVGALPVINGGATLGVLAVERTGTKRLERADLAFLAVLASRMGVALSVVGKSADETRPGFAA